MAQDAVIIPSCDWLALITWRKKGLYPNPAHWFVNLATRYHNIANFASGTISINNSKGDDLIIGKPGGSYQFNLTRSSDFTGKFSIAFLLPSSCKLPASKIIKEVSLCLYSGGVNFTLTGEENYNKAIEEGLWPYRTNDNKSSYYLIPLMFQGYIHMASMLGDGNTFINVQLNEFETDEKIQMMMIGDAIVLSNTMREDLSKNPFNKLFGITIDEFAPNIKYQQKDSSEVIRVTDESLRGEYDLRFNNDSKAIVVEITTEDSELMNKSLPVKHLEVYWDHTLAIHAHAVNAREYYWKLCKLPVPVRTSFILPFSHDLITPHAASFNFTKIAGATLNLNIHPDWKDAKVNVTITSIGHEAHI
jgi:hypothetical protein